MKRIIFSLILCTMAGILSAQIVYHPGPRKKTRTVAVPAVHPLVPQITKKLNSTLRLDGASRSIVQIVIPPQTIEWHYSFTTRKDGSGEQSLQLAAQLSGLILAFVPGGQPFTGLPQAAVQTLKATSGSSPVNVYLLDANNANAFLTKKAYSYMNEGFATDATHAVVNLGYWPEGTFYIGIENRSSLKAVLVDLEAAAIKVEHKIQEVTPKSN